MLASGVRAGQVRGKPSQAGLALGERTLLADPLRGVLRRDADSVGEDLAAAADGASPTTDPGPYSASHGARTPAIVVILAAVVVVWAAMMIRKVMLLIAAVLAPLAFSGATADITRGWVRKWVIAGLHTR